MRRRNSRYTAKSEINIVPLLDVLLVLVLVFMATAPIINQSVEVDLPGSSTTKKVPSSEKKTIIIEVSDIGIYTLIVNQRRHTDLSKKRVVAEVKQQILVDKNTVFLVGGAKNVPYEEIIKALNLLQAAGVRSVGLMTEPI